MTVLDIQIMLVLASVSCAVLALIRLAEERAAWEEDAELMSGWLKERREELDTAHGMLKESIEAHTRWLEVAKGNAKRYKKQIATLKGLLTKERKKTAALKQAQEQVQVSRIETNEQKLEEVRSLLRLKATIIPAVKRHREIFGSSLKDAADWCKAEYAAMQAPGGSK